VCRKLKFSPFYQYLTDYTEYILQRRITRRTTKAICQFARQNRPVNLSHSQLVTRPTRHTLNSSHVTSWSCDELIGSLINYFVTHRVFVSSAKSLNLKQLKYF